MYWGKTDCMDGDGRIRALMALLRGEYHACRMVHISSVEEDSRRRQSPNASVWSMNDLATVQRLP